MGQPLIAFIAMQIGPIRMLLDHYLVGHSFSVVTGKGSHAKARRRRVLIRSLPLPPSRFRRVAGGVYLASLIRCGRWFRLTTLGKWFVEVCQMTPYTPTQPRDAFMR